MNLQEFFDSEIAPCVRADGGWLELAESRFASSAAPSPEILLTARGECARCPVLDRCLRWAESRVREGLNLEVTFRAVPDPFLWRK
jgi:Fe-S cluster biogenesis protein NfuA